VAVVSVSKKANDKSDVPNVRFITQLPFCLFNHTMIPPPKPGVGYRRVNRRYRRKARRCYACQENQHHWSGLVEVADAGKVGPNGRWVEAGDDELLDVYKLCNKCWQQAKTLVEADIIMEMSDDPWEV